MLGDSGDGGTWANARERFQSAKGYNDLLLATVGNLFARHGWTMVLLLVIWYNIHDPIKRRLRKWTNDRSLADANRPDRRAVLDRERMRALAAMQAEVCEVSRTVAEEKSQEKLKRYDAAPMFKKDV